MSKTVRARVEAVLADVANCEAGDLRDDTGLFRDLGLDSAGALELLVSLEDEFEIHIDTDEAREVETLGELVRLVEARLG